MARLPDTTGMKNEVVVVRSQRNFYDHAVRAAGVRLVEVGLPDRYAGAGVRDAEGVGDRRRHHRPDGRRLLRRRSPRPGRHCARS